MHIWAFDEVVAVFYSRNAAIDSIRLKIFPFSLKDKAKSWPNTRRPRSIGSWDTMTKTFFHKYFPHHKTNGLKQQISTFSQKESETLTQSWDRFKNQFNSRRHHGIETWRLVSYFYEGLTIREHWFIEKMCNGDFLHKDPDEALEYLGDLAEKSNIWSGLSATDGTNRSRPTGIYYPPRRGQS